MVSAAQAHGLLTNPGFELDTSGAVVGWTKYGSNVYGLSSFTQAHGGSNCLKVYQQFNGAVNYSGVYQDNLSGAGAVYAADGWAARFPRMFWPARTRLGSRVTFRDASHAMFSPSTVPRSSPPMPSPPGPFRQAPGLTCPSPINTTPAPASSPTTTALVAPAGTSFVRYQITFQGDAAGSAGSVYFDDLNLTQTAGGPQGNWNIVWSDEFNGTSINTNIWTYDLGNNGGWGNSELEYYTSSAQKFLRLQRLPSHRRIAAIRRRLQLHFRAHDNRGHFSAEYGRFEFRAGLPSGPASGRLFGCSATTSAPLAGPVAAK